MCTRIPRIQLSDTVEVDLHVPEHSKDEQRAAFATAAEVSVKEMYAKLLAIEAEKETAK